MVSKLPGDPKTGKEDNRDGGQELVSSVIDQVENSELPAVGHLVMDQVERPAGGRSDP